MSRNTLATFIKDFFSFVDSKIQIGSKNNLMDENVLAESTFREILNITYDLDYSNVNIVKSNTPGIDLLDVKNNVYCQVTSDKSKSKIDETIKKLPEAYSDFHLKFFMLVTDAQSARRYTYPFDLTKFNPTEDIMDFSTLFGIIMDLDTKKLLEIYKICQEEMSSIIDLIDFDESNLLKIVKTLSSNSLYYKDTTKISFKYLAKIEFNNLVHSKKTILRFSLYSTQVDQIYNSYDEQSSNISFSVIALIVDFYENARKEIALNPPITSKSFTEEDYVFECTVNKCIDYINHYSAKTELPFEEVLLYAKVLVINVFLRCDIFDNPEGYVYDIE